jgi:hypothetical protein
VQPGGLVVCAVGSLVGVDISWIAPDDLACVAVEAATGVSTGVCAGMLLWQAANTNTTTIKMEIFFIRIAIVSHIEADSKHALDKYSREDVATQKRTK